MPQVRLILGLAAVAGAAFLLDASLAGLHGANPAKYVPSQGNFSSLNDSGSPKNYSLAFFLNCNNPYYKSNLALFESNLKRGDYLLVSGPAQRASDIIKKTDEIRTSTSPGIHVVSVVVFRDISEIMDTVPGLPRGFDYVMYDYEGGSGYSPEFTPDEAASVEYFAEARDAVGKYDKNSGSSASLLVSPPYGELHKSGWNWTLAASNMDAIDIQLQAFATDPGIQDYAKNIVGQIRKSTGDKLVFVQLSIIPTRATIQENIGALAKLQDVRGINAFLIFYKNNQRQDLLELFRMLHR